METLRSQQKLLIFMLLTETLNFRIECNYLTTLTSNARSCERTCCSCVCYLIDSCVYTVVDITEDLHLII